MPANPADSLTRCLPHFNSYGFSGSGTASGTFGIFAGSIFAAPASPTPVTLSMAQQRPIESRHLHLRITTFFIFASVIPLLQVPVTLMSEKPISGLRG